MKLCNFEVGLDRPLFLIAGPCVIESRQLALDVAPGKNGSAHGALHAEATRGCVSTNLAQSDGEHANGSFDSGAQPAYVLRQDIALGKVELPHRVAPS